MYQQNYNYYPTQIQQPQGQPQPMPNQYPINYMRPAQLQTSLKGHLVSSLEEARATSIDFDGSIFYFPDLANKRIYTKQVNMDGTATLNVYELREVPNDASMNNFITREEFEAAIAKLQMSLIPPQAKPDIKPF